MTALPDRLWTPEEYLAFDRSAPIRHEYLDGSVYAMAGARLHHNLIVSNTIAALISGLGGRPCMVLASDQRVSAAKAKMYAYPDISVVCGAPRYDREQGDVLYNPTLIVEVLSPATEMFDRTVKFQRYQTIESLREYVLIAQDRPLVEVYTRQADERWLIGYGRASDAVVILEALGCTLALADVYRLVDFDTQAE